MWPTLISVGPLAIQSFGLMLFLGIFFGGFLFWQKGREEGFKEESLMDVWLVTGLVGLLMGRAWYVLVNWDFFVGSFYRMMFLTKFPGLSYQGVFLGAGLMLLVMATKNKWSVWRLMEVGVFSWLVVEMFGWFGSFLAGSNLGQVTTWFWGLGFPGVEGRRHPVQLIILCLLWLLYKLLKKWEKEYRSFSWYKADKSEVSSGFLVGAYLIGLSLVKLGVGFIIEQENLASFYWFFGVMFLLGGLIIFTRSGITIKSKEKKEVSVKRPEVKLKNPSTKLRIKKKKRKKQGFDFK